MVLAELGHRAFDHLLDDVGRLAALVRLLDRDRALALEQCRVQILGVERQRIGGGDVHRQLLAQSLQGLGRGRAFERDQHADLAHARRGGVVDVADDEPFRDLEHRGAAQRLVLADGGDIVGQLLLDGAAGRIGRALQRLDVIAGLERQASDVADEFLELLVLGDEVGFGIDLDDRALGALDGDADEPFGGGAAGLLGGGGEALGAQPVDRGLHLALGLGQRLLAVHHAGAGALAQFLDRSSGDLGHLYFL